MSSRWFLVTIAALALYAGAGVPIAQAGGEGGKSDTCIYIDVNGSPYYAPCSGDEVVPSGIPDASQPECVPSPYPCP